MTVYSKLGATKIVTANNAFTLNLSNVTTSLSGVNQICFVKVTNTSNVDVLKLSFNTSNTLSTDSDPVVIGTNTTEFIQVAKTDYVGNVYFYVSSANAIPGYVTPVTIVG